MTKEELYKTSMKPEWKKELIGAADAMVAEGALKEEDKEDFMIALNGVYMMSAAVFTLCPKIGELNLTPEIVDRFAINEAN